MIVATIKNKQIINICNYVDINDIEKVKQLFVDNDKEIEFLELNEFPKYDKATEELAYVDGVIVAVSKPTQLDRIEAAVQASKEMQDFYDAVMEEVGV